MSNGSKPKDPVEMLTNMLSEVKSRLEPRPLSPEAIAAVKKYKARRAALDRAFGPPVVIS